MGIYANKKNVARVSRLFLLGQKVLICILPYRYWDKISWKAQFIAIITKNIMKLKLTKGLHFPKISQLSNFSWNRDQTISTNKLETPQKTCLFSSRIPDCKNGSCSFYKNTDISFVSTFWLDKISKIIS